MLKIFRKLFIFIAFLAVNYFATAQKTSTYQPPLLQYHDGIELFNKEKFGAAQEKFNQLMSNNNTPSEMKANAAYYAAVCGLSLFNNDAENLAMDFIKSHPENPKINKDKAASAGKLKVN